jgi:hypothetical protein
MKIHDKLVRRWKEESCVLAAKRLVALQEAETGVVTPGKTIKTEQAQWLRKACKVTFAGWGRGLL